MRGQGAAQRYHSTAVGRLELAAEIDHGASGPATASVQPAKLPLTSASIVKVGYS